MSSFPVLKKSYVEQRNSAYWVGETRISLDSVVRAFLEGISPEEIARNFSLLTLEQVYGAIAFYLANQDLVDGYLREDELEFEQLSQSCKDSNPLLYKKLAALKDRRL